MSDDDDKDALAAEYVLGTLDTDERVQAQLMISVDKGFAAAVSSWERRLGELSAMVDSKEPPAETWDHVKAKIVGVDPSAALKLPAVEMSQPVTVAPAPIIHERGAAGADVIQLSRRVSRWRSATVLMGALAACLVAFIVLGETNPDMLPLQLRPKPKVIQVTNTIEVTAPAPAEFVAVLQKDTFSPAFLLTLDLAKRTVTVRAVGAEHQAGKSYELWLVSEKYATPQSLGLIGDQQFTVRKALEKYDAATVNRATYAVSLEPEGGSKTGVPTGPVLYTGKLVQATPPSIAQTP